MKNLDHTNLKNLLETVFRLRPEEKTLSLFVDLPGGEREDTVGWVDRRNIALEWFKLLMEASGDMPFRSIRLAAYENVGSNNNDLPASAFCHGDHLRASSDLRDAPAVEIRKILSESSVVIALTELSATAPLKMLGKELSFRGATMPGFSRDMIPVLALNYEDIHRRVSDLKERMDRSIEARLILESGGIFEIVLDLRFRQGHASGGLMRGDGEVGNLPSGESYIVPYEGEIDGEKSRSRGVLPVQFGDELVRYKIVENKALHVLSSGRISDRERAHLRNEPAYGNIAELGIGVLGQWGVEAVGSILLDEKLGLHVAFGRSEHFGGITTPSSFNDPKNVVHIDRVYVPSLQPMISVKEVKFVYEDSDEIIIRNGEILI